VKLKFQISLASNWLFASDSKFTISLNYITNLDDYFLVTELSALKPAESSIELFAPNDKPFGLTYGEWTVKWWQWALSIPAYESPILDNHGEKATVQQFGEVWFLAGTFGENRFPQRKCSVPRGKCLLFPVINYEMNVYENPDLDNDADLIDHVRRDMDDIVNKIASVDNVDIPIYRIQSVPAIFPLVVNNENCIGIKGGLTMVAADGYWVFLKPLPLGNHEIYFHGSCSGGVRNSTARYYLLIE